MKINSQIVRLEFLEPFGISKLTRSYQDALRVELSEGIYVGYGESPAISYYGKDAAQMKSALDQVSEQLAKVNWTNSDKWYPEILSLLPNSPFVRAAVDAAAWDLFGKRNKVAVWEYLGLENPSAAKPSNFTIGIGSPDYVKKQIEKYPWTSYKLKLGSDQDEAVLKGVSEVTKRALRLDANGAWDVAKTKSFLNFCANNLPKDMIEMIEEPFSNLSEPGLAQLKNASPIPFYADESFQSKEDLKKIGKYFHGVNIKLDKCGGLTPAFEIIQAAKEQGLKIQLGCMSASGIALAPAIQLSTLADIVDLDATLLIVDADYGVYYTDGVARMRGRYGMGIE